MKIVVLSRNAKLYSTVRLVEAGRQRGHRVRVLDPLRCYMRIAPNDFSIHSKGRAVAGCDAVIPRVGASITLAPGVTPKRETKRLMRLSTPPTKLW